MEHGPFSDDEINIIEEGKNYGHPMVIGYDDGNYNGLAAAASDHTELPGKWHTTYPTIVDEAENAKKIGSGYRNPIKTFYPTSHQVLQNILERVRSGQDQTWISEAPSSIELYTSDAIPGWKNSLLVTTLKTGKLIRLKLSRNGEAISGDTITCFKSANRFRDLAISGDGRKIYLSVDSTANSSEPSKIQGQESECVGCIIEYSYER